MTKADWCAIGERYATAGPTGGDFIAGYVQGLTDVSERSEIRPAVTDCTT